MRIRITDSWPHGLETDDETADRVFDRERLAEALNQLAAAEPLDREERHHPERQ